MLCRRVLSDLDNSRPALFSSSNASNTLHAVTRAYVYCVLFSQQELGFLLVAPIVLLLLLFRYLRHLTYDGAFGLIRGDLQYMTVFGVFMLAVSCCVTSACMLAGIRGDVSLLIERLRCT